MTPDLCPLLSPLLPTSRLALISQSVSSASVLFDLPSVWDTSSQSSMDQLKELIVLCSHAAIASAYAVNFLSRMRVSQSSMGADAAPGGAAPLTAAAAAVREEQQPKTFAELLAALSSTALCQPASVSVHASVGVAGSIIKTAVSGTAVGCS